MVKKIQKAGPKKMGSAPLSDSVQDSAQLIWQAGLGAFSRAQAEGAKAFESLVKDGMSLQRKTQTAAEEKISETTHKMTDMASGLSTKATGQWDKLEGIFEERVAKALSKLGVPTAQDVNALMARIEALSLRVEALSAKRPEAPTAKAPGGPAADLTVKAPAAPPAVKRVRARKAAPAVAPPLPLSSRT